LPVIFHMEVRNLDDDDDDDDGVVLKAREN
jgi:hypothetical protein